MRQPPVTDIIADQFRLLRNRIESGIGESGIVLVTSATATDRSSQTACGVVDAFIESGRRTAFVTTDLPLANDCAGARRDVVTISPEQAATMTRTDALRVLHDLRQRHDLVVVDAGALSVNAFGLLLLGAIDAVLIAFRTGRARLAADRAMLEALERTQSAIFGVVMTDAAIAGYAGRVAPARKPQDASMPRSKTVRAETFEVSLQRAGKSL